MKPKKIYFTHIIDHWKIWNKHRNMYLQAFCLQAVVVDSLMTLDTKSPDQSATENDYARIV